MVYTQKETDWSSKEKRQMFVDKIGAFIIKCGSEKDPVLEKIFPLAKEIVDKAWEVYPDKNNKEEEKPL